MRKLCRGKTPSIILEALLMLKQHEDQLLDSVLQCLDAWNTGLTSATFLWRLVAGVCDLLFHHNHGVRIIKKEKRCVRRNTRRLVVLKSHN